MTPSIDRILAAAAQLEDVDEELFYCPAIPGQEILPTSSADDLAEGKNCAPSDSPEGRADAAESADPETAAETRSLETLTPSSLDTVTPLDTVSSPLGSGTIHDKARINDKAPSSTSDANPVRTTGSSVDSTTGRRPLISASDVRHAFRGVMMNLGLNVRFGCDCADCP